MQKVEAAIQRNYRMIQEKLSRKNQTPTWTSLLIKVANSTTGTHNGDDFIDYLSNMSLLCNL